MSVKDYNLFNTGKFYYQWGNDVIGIYPTPTEIKKIRIHYIAEVSDMEKGDDEPNKIILEEHQEALVAYAVLQLVKRLAPQLYPLYKEEWEKMKEEISMGSKIIREEIIQSTHRDF
tara:strand:+ start:1598 stop:1945 length:348 start_codon:yes stop_codon:yes gene_type:complete